MPVLTMDDKDDPRNTLQGGTGKSEMGKRPGCSGTRCKPSASLSASVRGEVVMAAHEQLMRDFLASQQRGMEALLDKISPRQ